MNAKVLHTILTACLLLSLSCTKAINDAPVTNKQPKTYLWLFPDSTIGVGNSRQQLRWWGEDPDGVIRGYLFAFVSRRASQVPSPDTLRYTWITKNDTLMQFPLDTLFRYFTVFVRAVDNTFPGLPPHSIVRLTPQPYVDNNRNGILDATDQRLTDLLSATDPLGATLAFPIRNTKPTITFSQNPNDPANSLRLPNVTYTSISLGFKGSDLDGDNTLANYRIALNDTSSASWLNIPLRDTVITLVVPRARSDAAPPTAGAVVAADVYGGRFVGRQLLGQLQGLRLDTTNIVYVQAKDVAGEFSSAIRLPQGTQRWFVKRPRARLLLVQDYTNPVDADSAVATYTRSLAAVPGGQFQTIDILNIAAGLTVVDKTAGRISTSVPPFIDPALINTFLLYDYVLWYTDQVPSLGIAQSTLFTYLQNGGKLIFSTTFSTAIDPRGALKDFAPIDSVSSVALPASVFPVPGDTRIPASYILFADSTDPTNVYPQLAFNAQPANHIIFMRDVYRRADARVIYRLQPDARNPRRYNAVIPGGGSDTLRPKVGFVDGQGKIVFFGLPLHLLDNRVQGNPAGLTAFFSKVFTGQFSPMQRIDRRKF